MTRTDVDPTALVAAAARLRSLADGLSQLRSAEFVRTGHGAADDVLLRVLDTTSRHVDGIAATTRLAADAASSAASTYVQVEAR